MLNKLQEQFVERMKDNIAKKKTGIYLLEAPAGCGKTYCAKYLLDDYQSFGNKKKCYIIAPTHKAKQMLQKSMKKRNVETIHRFLRGELYYTSAGVQKYKFNPIELKNCIIFVDECSMINDEIYDIIKDKYSDNNYIIYAGDSLQLPPIEKEIEDEVIFGIDKIKKSKAFDKKNVVEYFELTENMRARTNPLGVFQINKARETIKKKVLPDFIAKTDTESFLNFIKKNNEDFIILAYSNVKVNYYNKLIRTVLYNNGKTDDLKDYYINEKLVFSGYRYIDNVINYHTSDIITIKDLNKKEIELKYIVCDCNDELEECKQCGISNHKTKSLKIDFWEIIDQYYTKWYKPYSEVDLKKFYKLQKHYKDHCIKMKQENKWKEYYSFINLYNSDLRYTYSSTIHKSQGDEWDNVFLDRENLIKCAKSSLLRLTAYYTAVSRMKKEVYEIIKKKNI